MLDERHSNKRLLAIRKTRSLTRLMAFISMKELPKCAQGGLLLKVVEIMICLSASQ